VKQCRACLLFKPFDSFYHRSDAKDGVRADCKACVKERTRRRYYSDLEKSRAEFRALYRAKIEADPDWHAKRYAANKAQYTKNNRLNYERHKTRRRRAASDWAKRNVGKANARKQAYKVTKKQALPLWVVGDEYSAFFFEEAYSLANLRTRVTGVLWHVDHIIPLRGRAVCGLHTPCNLQVIPAAINCRKSNKLLPEASHGIGSC